MLQSVSSYAANDTSFPKPIKAEVTVACKRDPVIQKAQSMENFILHQNIRQ